MVSVFQMKHMAARALGAVVDLDRLIVRGRGRHILCYHRVLPLAAVRADYVHDAMWIAPETLEAQIRWMQSVGEIVDYRCIVDLKTPNDRPLFCLTFDDGWRDNYTHAFPILKKYQVPALIFLVSEKTDSGDLFWTEDLVTKTHHRVQAGHSESVCQALRELQVALPSASTSNHSNPAAWAEHCVEGLKLLDPAERTRLVSGYFAAIGAEQAPIKGEVMSWSEMREMRQAGIDFGSHTHSHRILRGAAEADIREELTISRQIISRQLGEDIETFCYPNARYNGNEGPLLRDSGYRYAFKIGDRALRDSDDPYYLPRFMVYDQIAENPHYFKLRLLEMPAYRVTAA